MSNLNLDSVCGFTWNFGQHFLLQTEGKIPGIIQSRLSSEIPGILPLLVFVVEVRAFILSVIIAERMSSFVLMKR